MRLLLAMATTLPALFCSTEMCAQDGAAGGVSEVAQISIADRPLVDQTGQAASSRALLIGERPTIVSFTFAGCQTVCPVSDLIMSAIDARQDKINLVTLTIDPLSDSAEIMGKQADAISASSRWKWLTGEPRDVWDVNASLGMSPASLEDHASFYLVVAPRGDEIVRVDGLAGPDDLLRVTERMAKAQ